MHRLCDLADMKEALAPTKTTILKDNIFWHYPFPAANTTPWQPEGTIQALRASGFDDVTCVQNKTMVTDALLVHIAIAISEGYHDYFRWNTMDKRVFDKWRQSTEWGHLFDQYAAGPPAFQTPARGANTARPAARA
jgi:hypothetical protein